MAMVIDTQQRNHLGSLGYDMPYSVGTPSFNNPWSTVSSAHPSSHLFPSPLAASNLSYENLSKSQSARSGTTSLQYSPLPVNVAAAGTGNGGSYSNLSYNSSDLMNSSRDLLNGSRSTYDHTFSNTSPLPAPSYPPQPATYNSISLSGQSLAQQQQQQHQQENLHRLSQINNSPLPQSQPSFDTLEGAREMVALSQDITPRNIYGPRVGRNSIDSYGFPSTHSSHSSISSTSTYPQYYAGSVDSSATDYSSASESMEPLASRTLPLPSGFVDSNLPPAPSSMMGSFNSKISPTSQKKHKCKICDKRFTRPSSLQTHTYSHTGEKPFTCEVHGCGRNFSVVSNLRRHRKVHKNDRLSDHGSPAGSWTSSDR